MSNIIQNTKEWHKWRSEGIGASEASIIMGVSPYKTRRKLWEEKTNPTPPTDNKPNYIQQKGHDIESKMRPIVELENFTKFPPVTLEWEENRRFRASLDGYDSDNKINWECKLLGKDLFDRFKEYGEIPEKYYPQLMHQCLVSGANKFMLTCAVDFNEYHTRSFELNENDYKYIQEELIPSVEKFIHLIDNKIPPDMSPNDVAEVTNKNLVMAIDEYSENLKMMNHYKENVDKLKEMIFIMSGSIHNKVNCNGALITISKSEDKEVPDYEGYAKEMNIDLMGLGWTKLKKGRETRRITLKGVDNV